MLPLGTPAPDFHLTDVVTSETVHRGAPDDDALLVMFICKHCPYVKHVQDELAAIGRDYQEHDLRIVAIGSNDPEISPADTPEGLKEQAETVGFTFPYLFDGTQSVARAYQAACTPDFFLFDKSHKLVYRGQLDASRPGSEIPVTGRDLRRAIDAVLDGEPVSEEQRPSIGCNIKWRR